MKTKKIIDTAKRYLSSKKIKSFEIFYIEKDHLLTDAKDGRIESLQEATDVGLAIRVIDDNRLGFSYTTPLLGQNIKEAVDKAVAGSKEVDPDEAWSFTKPDSVRGFEWCHVDPDIKAIPVSKKNDIALRLEEAALKFDPRLKRVRKSEYEESWSRVRLVNSEGVELAFEKTLFSCDVVAVAESDGDSQWAWEFDFSHKFTDLDVEKVGESAAKLATSLLGARVLSTRRTAACLHPFVAAIFLKTLGKAFYGDNIYKRKSVLCQKLGSAFYSDILNILDDGLMAHGYGSSPFDGEGHPSARTYIVRKGVVESWLTDNYWGNKLNFHSTGSSIRESVKGLPAIGISNLYIEPTGTTREQLFSRMGDGLYITGIIGAHTINPVTGEFSVGADGQLLERGVVRYPVKGFLIAGNLHDLLRNVVGVGNDLRFMGEVGSPTILVSDLQVSGQ